MRLVLKIGLDICLVNLFKVIQNLRVLVQLVWFDTMDCLHVCPQPGIM